MYLVKNTYGISTVISPRVAGVEKIGEYGGSSLNRKTYPKKVGSLVEELLKKPLYKEGEELKPKKQKLRAMSQRTKAKIRKKIIALSRIDQKLSFLTLTFCNKVDDKKGVRVLADFLENCNKRLKDFQYLWVAEKQEHNKAFKDNIHFHIITNERFWDLNKWRPYWFDLQKRHGIVPVDENYKPFSAFYVKPVQKENIRGLVKYLTSYVTKNTSSFGCQVWNCSKKISRLYTDFYTGLGFIEAFERLEREGQLGGEIRRFSQEYCNVNLIPLNRITLKFYERLETKNTEQWSKLQEKEEYHA